MLAQAAEANQTIPFSTGAGNDRFCEVFDAYQPALQRLVAAYVINTADREDLLQEIASAICKALPGFRGESSERTWIYRIAHNIAIRYAAGVRARNAREPMLEGGLDRPSGDTGAEATLLLDERRRILLDSIRELPLADRQIVTLHLEGLSAAEIEEITSVSQGAVVLVPCSSSITFGGMEPSRPIRTPTRLSVDISARCQRNTATRSVCCAT